MRTVVPLALLLPAMAQAKKPEAPPEQPPSAPVAAPPSADPEPEPEPVPEPPAAPNTSFQAVITHADGSVTRGHVVRVTRGTDRYALDGWTDTASKLTVTLEGGGTEIEASWKDIRSIDIKYAPITDVDCQFDTSFTPTLYLCVLKGTPTVKTADGKTWQAASLHKWRFGFEGGSEVDFYAYKLPALKQEPEEASLKDGGIENTALYAELQKELSAMVKGKAVTKIVITP
jgi:hypothetical protein